MLHTQWPGLGPAFELAALDETAGTADPSPWPHATGVPGGDPMGADGVAALWWNGNGRPPAAAPTVPQGDNLAAVLGGLIGTLRGILASLCSLGETQPASGQGPEQRYDDVEVSSTGDPHLAVVGTRCGPHGTTESVNDRFDSMDAHPDLLHTDEIEGGYRVSTEVGAANANGVTMNRSATVSAFDGFDTVTLNADGAYAIRDDGDAVTLARGAHTTLSGGETVTANADGSLTVSAHDDDGGTIETTMRTNAGGGVDVTTRAHDLALGGDAIERAQHDAPPGVRRGHRRHHRHAEAAAAQ